MKYEAYETRQVKGDFDAMEFYSHGKNGVILKRAIFTNMGAKDIYSLGFGSVDENDEINDMSITDNGDRDRILVTIYDIILRYTQKYPERWIYFEGSTQSRTRLYRMAIGLNLEALSEKFLIYAYYDECCMPFTKNLTASAFLIKRK